MGTFTTYKGGGYVVTLGRTLNKSLTIMNELKVRYLKIMFY